MSLKYELAQIRQKVVAYESAKQFWKGQRDKAKTDEGRARCQSMIMIFNEMVENQKERLNSWKGRAHARG